MPRSTLVSFTLASLAIPLLVSFGCAGAPVPAEHPVVSAPPASTALAESPKPAPDATAPAESKAAEAGPLPVAVAVPIDGTSFVRGRATVNVKAPIDRVRDTVLDFGHYAEFMPHYRSCNLLGRTPAGARSVHMEVEALNGMVRMWAEIEMPKPVHAGDVETHESQFVKGNVKELKAIWRLRKLDDANTELTLEVFLNPSIPLPMSLMNSENLKGAAEGVAAMRTRAERAAP